MTDGEHCCLRLDAAQHFEGYDSEGFSFWFCDYKYDEENTVNFIVMNKVRSPACRQPRQAARIVVF